MNKLLATYLQDHLAGARFAIDLLQDLRKQEIDDDVARSAATLLPEIEQDRVVREDLLTRLNGDGNLLKNAAAWVMQKAGRFKLPLDHPFGLFEAVEVLSLGVLGKLALWNALKSLRDRGERLDRFDLDGLSERTRAQFQQLEAL